jgi:hypothetical protein
VIHRGTAGDDPGVVDRWVDAGCEYLVVGFGTWTVLYHLGCWLGLSTTPLLVATVALTAAIALLGARVTRTLGRTRPSGGARHRAWPFLAVSVVLAVGASAALTGADSDYPLGWWLALGSVASLVALLVWEGPVGEEPVDDEPVHRMEGGPAGDPPERPPPPTRQLARTASSVAVLLVAVAGGVLSLFVRNVSFDDVFYVNKAVFVAEHGTIPMRDTIYTDQAIPAIRGAGTVPVQSFEVLQGAVAHVLGISGGTVVYLLTPPLVIALCVWVMWWLARTWSSGPALAAFAVAVAYLTFGIYLEPGAEGSIAMSSIPLRAAWQGKVVLLCVALPIAYLALSRWALHRRLRDLVLLVAVGAGAVGLSSTAAFLVPPVAVAAALALLLTRRPGWLGALALGAYPLGAGLVASALGDGAGYGELLRTAPEAYHGVVGRGPWGWLGSLALLLGAWGVRRGAGRSVAAAAAVGAVVLLAPSVPELVQDLTGAGPLAWRLPWVIPVPVLLGVLAAAPVAVARGEPAGSQASTRPLRMPSAALSVLGWVPLVVVLAVVVATGRTVWDPGSPNEMASTPVWKFPAVELDRAAEVAQRARGLHGPVLAPRLVMGALALTTTDVHAVDPRAFFLPGIVEDVGRNGARRRLSSDMRPERATRVLPTFGTDLDRLGVLLVCLDDRQVAARDAVTDLGWVPDAERALDLRCWRRPA